MLHKFNLKTSQIIILLIAISILIRILYAGIQPQMMVTADSLIYYDLASKMFSEPSVKLVINPFKTPLYGLTIYAVMLLFGDKPASVGTLEFAKISEHVILVQQLIGIIGVIILFKLTLLLTKSSKISFVVALVHAINFLNLPWERAMLTESPGTLFVIVYAYLTLLILQKPKPYYFLSLLIISVLGFLLRPALMLFPALGIILISLVLRKSKIFRYSSLVLSLYLLAIWVFIRLNYQNWQYRGIQITSEINLLGKVLQYNLPLVSSNDHGYFYQIVSDYRTRGLPNHPYRLLDYYEPGIYLDFVKLQSLREFCRQAISHNLVNYLGESLMLLPQALSSIDQTISVKGLAVKPNPVIYLFSFGQDVYSFVQLSGLMIFVVLPVCLYKLFANRLSLNDSFVTVIALLTVQQVLLSVLLSYEEYGRLVTVVSPLLLFILIYGLRRFTIKLDK